jgi:hypothetical protein
MVNWQRIDVPVLEWPLAEALGAERSNGSWWCSATRHRSKPFRRWHSTACHKRVVVYPGDGQRARAEAKENSCRWDPAAREWYVMVTSDSSLRSWHRARMQPPPTYVLSVDYNQRDAAKLAGCRWQPEEKRWVFACHGPPPQWVLKRALAV